MPVSDAFQKKNSDLLPISVLTNLLHLQLKFVPQLELFIEHQLVKSDKQLTNVYTCIWVDSFLTYIHN